MKASNKRFWDIKAAATPATGEIYIYGNITRYKWEDEDVTALSFKKDLETLGDIQKLNLYVNSPGGSAFQAQAIFSILARHTAFKTAYIDAIAASAASFLIMACDHIVMPKNTMMMIHNPMTYGFGNATAFRKLADMLDKAAVGMIEAYMTKIGDKTTEDKLKELLEAESFLTAQECFDHGFCDELIEAKADIAANIDIDFIVANYQNVPEFLKSMCKGGDDEEAEMELRAQIAADAKLTLERVVQSKNYF